MKEVNLKNNRTGYRVFINGEPNFNLIPKEEMDTVVNALEIQLTKIFKQRLKSKKSDSAG